MARSRRKRWPNARLADPSCAFRRDR